MYVGPEGPTHKEKIPHPEKRRVRHPGESERELLVRFGSGWFVLESSHDVGDDGGG